MPQNAASDQGIHCLYEEQEFQYNMVLIKTTQTNPAVENGPVQKLEVGESIWHNWVKGQMLTEVTTVDKHYNSAIKITLKCSLDWLQSPVTKYFSHSTV